MLTFCITRNGELHGCSIIPTRGVHNPYFLFGCEITEENLTILKNVLSWARGYRNPTSTLPEYTIRLLLLFIDSKGKIPISYPEAGVMNDSQSLLALVFIKLHELFGDITIYTVSECMIRYMQYAVKRGIIKSEQIEIYDTTGSGRAAQPMQFEVGEHFEVKLFEEGE